MNVPQMKAARAAMEHVAISRCRTFRLVRYLTHRGLK